jgi:cobalt-zinc-cadmium efflux system membrane fusion protein
MTSRFLVALVVVLVCAAACSRHGSDSTVSAKNASTASVAADQGITIPPDSPQLARITVAAVRAARVPADVLEAPGKIEADSNRVSRVVLPAPGRVSRVMVHVGDAVARGAALLAIDSPDIGATLSSYRQAQARLGQSRAAQTKADADLARARDLFENRAIAQKEVLAAESAAAQAKADVEQAESAVSESRKKLEIFGIQLESADQAIVVRAPVAGKVLEMTVVAGEYRTDTSVPLMTIADLSSVFMTADVPETQIRLVKEGTDVDVMLSAYPGEMFHAKVSRIADTVDPQTRTIRVRSSMSNPSGRLRPEMFGQIRYATNFSELPIVPASAVVRDEERSSVYREDGRGHFRAVAVVLGTRSGDSVAVVRGVQSGDRIVVDGVMLLTRR